MNSIRVPLVGLLLLGAVLAPLGAPPAAADASFDVLQLNLCNSGLADCYDGGQSIPEGVEVINRLGPSVVTINEVCRDDITRMANDTGYRGEFTPARDSSSGSAYQCANGQDYGIGVLTSSDEGTPVAPASSGTYSAQDGGREQRVFFCVSYSRFGVCATHLSTDGGVALRQCSELMAHAGELAGRAPTVVGGDLNMKYGGNPDVQDCVPSDWFRKGDGDVQHVLATTVHFAFERTSSHDMMHTNHPAFSVELSLR